MGPENLSELVEWARQAQHEWLFLDYDGTLADLSLFPNQILPDPQINELLKRLLENKSFESRF